MYLLFMYLFLLFYQIQGLIFYYDTNTSNLNTIEYKYKNYNNSDIFVFLPGTNAYCENYSQLFYTVNNRINILCINYKSRYEIVLLNIINTILFKIKVNH